MALIVEDGSNVSGAESYATQAEADAYHSARGNDTWATLTDIEVEEALRRATDYMQETYAGKWDGYKANDVQALDWPRAFVTKKHTYLSTYYDDDVVPNVVKNACIELAFEAARGELTPKQTQQVIREKVDVLEVEYSEHSSSLPKYTKIDRMLSIFFKSGSFGAFRSVERV